MLAIASPLQALPKSQELLKRSTIMKQSWGSTIREFLWKALQQETIICPRVRKDLGQMRQNVIFTVSSYFGTSNFVILNVDESNMNIVLLTSVHLVPYDQVLRGRGIIAKLPRGPLRV